MKVAGGRRLWLLTLGAMLIFGVGFGTSWMLNRGATPTPTPSDGPAPSEESAPVADGPVDTTTGTGTAPDLADGEYDPSALYEPGDEVSLDGVRFEAIAQTIGWRPSVDGHPSGAIGFGAQALGGGADAAQVTVTTTADDGPGSLRAATAGAEPKWVRFDVSGPIELNSALSVGSNTTIDGRGQEVVITGYGLDIRESENIIVTNLTFDTLMPQRHEVDGVRVLNGSSDIWLDHLTIERVNDEAINIGEFSTDVTVSWVHIADQDRGILVGNHTDHQVEDDPSHVTIHNTWFEQTNQRSPRAVRWAEVHLFNSLVERWGATGMSAAQHAELRSEGNIILAPEGEASSRALVTRPGQGRKNPDAGLAVSVDDRVVGGSVSDTDGADVFDPPYDYYYRPADEALEELLRAHTGAQVVPADGPWRQVS